MPLDPALAATLRRLHAEFIRAKTPRSRVLRRAAKALGILPITDDWTQFFGIRITDGEVMAFDGDPPFSPRVEPVSRRRLAILNDARFRHPELEGLIPPRPDDAIDCEFCEGCGERTGADGILRSCPHCAAGWVPLALVQDD